MSQSNDSNQLLSLCGGPLCNGSSCDTCKAIRASLDDQARIQCPHKAPYCCTDNLCDQCFNDKYPRAPIGGSASGVKDVHPEQDFNIVSSGIICENCQQPEGSNRTCQICAFFRESDETAQNGEQNPTVPTSVVFQHDIGPRQGDLCALTEKEVQASVDLLRLIFASMVLPLIPIASSISDSHVGQWRGCEWSSGNCWLVVILQMFQTGSWNTSINVSNPLGNALWILVYELRTRGVVPRQRLQAFRRLMQEIIGQPEKGTLFERGQMDPFEALWLLQNKGAFSYDYTLSSESFIQGINATPVVDLGLSPSSSRNLIDKIGALNIDIEFKQESKFSCLPSTLVIKVSLSERNFGSTVNFPASPVFDLGPLTFQIMSVMLFINGHYLTVFIRLRYDPQTDTLSATYWLSDSKSDVQDCGHHVPSINEIDQAQFEYLWTKHAISITCVRIPKIVQIDGIPHELNGSEYEPLKPGWDSLPQCDKGQYTTFGQKREIRIKNCMNPLDFQITFSPPPPAPCASGPCVPHAPSAHVSPPPPPPVPCAQVAQALPPPPPACCVVWFEDDYRTYDPENNVLRSTLTGRIIDNIRAGYYDVREKETRREIRIKLREVLSDDALPPPAPRAQVFSQIQLADITIRDGEWSIRRGSFFQSGTCVVSLNQYTLERVQYDQSQFLTFLNILYKKSCE